MFSKSRSNKSQTDVVDFSGTYTEAPALAIGNTVILKPNVIT
jgi:hypothetical protein